MKNNKRTRRVLNTRDSLIKAFINSAERSRTKHGSGLILKVKGFGTIRLR